MGDRMPTCGRTAFLSLLTDPEEYWRNFFELISTRLPRAKQGRDKPSVKDEHHEDHR
jgi:hypothetical protein